jgi:glutamine cyclotransferase
MHFGLPKNKTLILVQLSIVVGFILCLTACRDKDKSSYVTFASPEQGKNYNAGDDVPIILDIPKDVKVDQYAYFLDNKLLGLYSGTNPTVVSTKGIPLGYRMITAIIYRGDEKDTINTNFVLKSNTVPVQIKYKIENTFPHDTSAYTEGLAYVDGKLLESTGEKGASKLKYVDLKTGKASQQIQLPAQYFGEGSLKIGDKIIMLTWQENIGFIFDAKTLKQLGTFPYEQSREGWGLTFDGKNILRTDGSNRIWQMNASTYKEEGYIEVYDNKGPLDSLNEMEFINGKIYANVYLTNKIVRIDPKTGIVEAEIDLSALVPKNFFKTPDEQNNNVLNGIAWDAKGKRLFVGGKKWPKLYEIKLLN